MKEYIKIKGTNQKLLQRERFLNLRAQSMPDLQERVRKKVEEKLKESYNLNTLKGYIGIFWPIKGEVDLRKLKDSLDLPFALPVSHKNGRISYHQWTNSPLINDSCGIPAPINQKVISPSEISLILAPALSIDHEGYRLGYGGGYFDRLRSSKEWRSVPSLVVLSSNCISLNPLPRDSWDIPFNGWIDEEGEWETSN